MIKNPLISIITPTLNSASTIEACLKSVACQHYSNLEHLIIDGLSTDETILIIKKNQKKYPHIRLISEQDKGIYDAMNKGIRLAKGEWILFLGSDDTLYEVTVLETLLPKLINKRIDIIYGNVIFKISGNIYDGKFNKFKLLKRNICHQAIITRKTVFSKLGNYELDYKALADWHFNMKWYNNRRIKHVYTNQIIAYYYEDGYSFNNPDTKFAVDWDINISRYFPFLVWKMHLNKHSKIVRYLTKILYGE